jgi:hypothetical protein
MLQGPDTFYFPIKTIIKALSPSALHASVDRFQIQKFNFVTNRKGESFPKTRCGELSAHQCLMTSEGF